MSGDLSETTPVDLCLRLAGERATGTLALAGPGGEAVMVFAGGRLTGGRPPGHGAPLGERLVAAGRLARPDLDTALADQTAEPGPAALGRLLVERGLADEDEVRLFVQEQAIDTLLDVAGWLEGSWDFRPATGVAPTGAGPGMPVEQVVEEVRRRAAERAQVAELVPSPTTVFVTTGDGDGTHGAPGRVLEAVDGQRSVRDVADALGVGVDEASRQLYRLVLQGRVVPADTMGTSPARAPAEPATEDAALYASTTTGSPPVQLADDGWAAARSEARTVAEEPEPWVGWANGGPKAEPTDAEVAPSGAGASSLWNHAPRPATPADTTTPPVPGPATPTPGADADTRRQLFSELHEVGRTHPGIGAAPAPAASPAPAEPVAADPPAPDEEAETVSTPEPTSAPLSRSDVSDLLRELHALNLDD